MNQNVRTLAPAELDVVAGGIAAHAGTATSGHVAAAPVKTKADGSEPDPTPVAGWSYFGYAVAQSFAGYFSCLL